MPTLQDVQNDVRALRHSSAVTSAATTARLVRIETRLCKLLEALAAEGCKVSIQKPAQAELFQKDPNEKL